MNKRVIVSCSNFLSLRVTSRKILSEQENFLVSVTEEEFANLSAEDLEKLTGVNLTDEECNVKIIDTLKREELPPQNMEFFINEIKTVDVKVIEQSFKEKHKERSKPYCPKNIINKKYNSKKKGGR